jgi:transcriptional regulator with XRE-family HTH domain
VNNFGEKLRSLRQSKGLLLRQAAAYIEVDTAFLSKVERGEKKATREQAVCLSAFLGEPDAELLNLWLSDKLLEIVEDEPTGISCMQYSIKVLKKERNNV